MCQFGGLRIPSLFFTDDVVLMAKSNSDFQLALALCAVKCAATRNEKQLWCCVSTTYCNTNWTWLNGISGVHFHYRIELPLENLFVIVTLCITSMMASSMQHHSPLVKRIATSRTTIQYMHTMKQWSLVCDSNGTFARHGCNCIIASSK